MTIWKSTPLLVFSVRVGFKSVIGLWILKQWSVLEQSAMLLKTGFPALRKSSPSHRRSIQPGYNKLQDDLAAFLLAAIYNKINVCFWDCGARCWWHSWLRHCATSRKVTGSIPGGVTGIFHWHNPSGRTMALGLTQPLTEMSTRNIYWG